MRGLELLTARGFLSKRDTARSLIFSVHTTLEKLENEAITVHFGYVFEENLDRERTRIL